MKRKTYLVITVIGILILTILVILIGDKSLDMTSEEVNNLYKLLGDINLVQCGSLNTYNENETKREDIPLENRLCLAYNNVSKDNLKSMTVKSDKVSSNKVYLCQITENITFAGGDKECSYVVVNKEDINNSYQKIYGEEIPKYLKFSPESAFTCYYDNDEYYCGLNETYDLTLYSKTNVLRLMNKALKNYSGEIIIEDYYLKIVNNKCYKTNGEGQEDTTCTAELNKYEDFSSESSKEKTKFLKKYGQKYRHVFKLNEATNEYYWYKSYQK